MKVLTAAEARKNTDAGLKRNNNSQFEEIMAGIDAASNSPHPRYHFEYHGIISPDVKSKLIDLKYKVLPPHYSGILSEPTTQIEW